MRPCRVPGTGCPSRKRDRKSDGSRVSGIALSNAPRADSERNASDSSVAKHSASACSDAASRRDSDFMQWRSHDSTVLSSTSL